MGGLGARNGNDTPLCQYGPASISWLRWRNSCRIFISIRAGAEDNAAMNKERSLLPWIFGAVSATAAAVAITAVSSNRTAPTPVLAAQSTLPVLQSPAPPAALASPAAPTPAAAAQAPAALAADAIPGAEGDQTAPPSASQAQAVPEAPAPSGQIWECTTKGVKTFSNNPCGDKPTLLEVGPINTMNPTPAVHYARAYSPDPRYAPSYADANNAVDQDSYSDAIADSGGNSYAIIQGVGFVARRRPEHPHHRPAPPNHHNFGPMPRKY